MTCSVAAVDELAFTVAPQSWPFAIEHRADIDAYFTARRRITPGIWNGRVLLMSNYTLGGRALRGEFFETDFASFMTWRDWNFPDRSVVNCFAMGALRTSDGAFLLGEMSAETANAGHVYFPSGTPDPSDIRDGAVDFTGSVVREVAEETGLDAGDFAMEPAWHAVLAGPRLALMRVLQAKESAEVLRRRIRMHIGREARPELSDIRIVRGPTDLDPMMPDFVTAYLSWMWQ
jgi:8-oxo-dGTP pyrophosphatase MutT (NUDIX family)